MVGNTNADELSVRQLNRLRNQDFGFVTRMATQRCDDKPLMPSGGQGGRRFKFRQPAARCGR